LFRAMRILAATCVLCASASLTAQSAPDHAATERSAASGQSQAGGNDIVVTGKHAQATSSGEVYDEARAITRVGRYETYVVALPRFWSPVCPGVFGLHESYAEAMVERMRDNIRRLKIPLAKDGCSPNLVVGFAEDGKALLADLKRDRPEVFGSLPESEQAEMLADTGPVRVWNNIAPRWTGASAPPRDWLHASVWGQLDRTSMPVSYDIVGALVVFDGKAVIGMSLAQLADYATMRGLSHTRPASSAHPMATILSLFDEEGADPAELTRFDLGYLRSLYWDRPNASAANKLVSVNHWIRHATKSAGDR